MTSLYDENGRIRHDAMLALLQSVVTEVLDSKLGEWSRRFDRLETDLAEVHRAITGNGFGIDKGIAGRIEELQICDKDIQRRLGVLEQKWDRLKWTLAGAAAGAGGLGGAIVGILVKTLGG